MPVWSGVPCLRDVVWKKWMRLRERRGDLAEGLRLPAEHFFMDLDPSGSLDLLPVYPSYDCPHLICQTQRSTHADDHTLALLPSSSTFALEVQHRRAVQYT